MGITQAGGTYTLAAGESGEGAWVGEHRVIVRAPEPVSYDQAPKEAQAPMSLPEKYGMVDTSGIVKQVAAGDNVINIELASE
jgi:hypothetical protein